MLYGVLAVLSERPGAFTTEERAVVRQLGEVVGQAITAVDRKRALMSDEVIEVEIRIPQLLASQVVSVNTDETVTVERWVPLGNDEYLLYGTTTAEGIELMRALGEQLSDWNNLHIIDDKNETVRFEQQLSNPPITSTIVDHGGSHVTGQIADGEYSARLHFPPGTDIRQVAADLETQHPSVEFVSQRQVTRSAPSPGQVKSILDENLTDRQRAALEAGYYGGFFEWPRDRSGEEVAQSLDIGASTFHQHLRKAEKALLDSVFD
jgi:predicted DNA binding protein